ncbi:MAG: hypothetical protein KatS3mg058_1670 [Roseiflexus sp.]|nr:MAG: hypothetical protein KatS3mg058_1670 [Roseiflexus sp.]
MTRIIPDLSKPGRRDQKLRSNLITNDFGGIMRRLHLAQIEHSTASKPDMREFVRQSKHLSCFAISSVDKHKRGIFINKNKTAKLSRIERTMRVIPNHTVRNDNNARDVCPILQEDHISESPRPRLISRAICSGSLWNDAERTNGRGAYSFVRRYLCIHA